jgi:hypothetical protein
MTANESNPSPELNPAACSWPSRPTDPKDFANQGAFLRNRQDAARPFTLLEITFASCSRTTPHGALSPALVAQLRTNIVNFFRLRAELVLSLSSPARTTHTPATSPPQPVP